MPPRRSRPRSRPRFRLPALPPIWSRPGLRYGTMVLLFIIVTLCAPRWWCGREGRRWYDGDAALTLAQARGVAALIATELASAEDDPAFPAAGERRFDALHLAALGLLQLCLDQPAAQAELLSAAEMAIDGLLSERIRFFDTKPWGEDALATLENGERGHAACLGRLNLVLGLHRRVVPDSRFAELNDRISATLVRRLLAARHGILESYPRKAYPADNAAVLGSLLLHARLTGTSHAPATAALLARLRVAWRESGSGMLFHRIHEHDGRPADTARASDTARAAFYLSFGERVLARELYDATRDRCADTWLGFGFIDEYPIGALTGRGDAPEKEPQWGISPPATGFMLAGARMFSERRHYVAIYRTAHLAGTPTSLGDERRFATGGPLGNALLLATLTARPELP